MILPLELIFYIYPNSNRYIFSCLFTKFIKNVCQWGMEKTFNSPLPFSVWKKFHPPSLVQERFHPPLKKNFSHPTQVLNCSSLKYPSLFKWCMVGRVIPIGLNSKHWKIQNKIYYNSCGYPHLTAKWNFLNIIPLFQP